MSVSAMLARQSDGAMGAKPPPSRMKGRRPSETPNWEQADDLLALRGGLLRSASRTDGAEAPACPIPKARNGRVSVTASINQAYARNDANHDDAAEESEAAEERQRRERLASAAQAGVLTEFQALVDKEEHFRLSNKLGTYVLSEALSHGADDITNWLLEREVKEYYAARAGLKASSRGGPKDPALVPLVPVVHAAAAAHHAAVVSWLCQRHPALVDAPARGVTPVMAAYKAHATEVVTTLLAARASLKPARSGGPSLLHMAAGDGNIDMVKTLLEAGAPLNGTTSRGVTPLIASAAANHGVLSNMLLDSRADPCATVTSGPAACKSALHYAVEFSDMILIIRLVREANVPIDGPPLPRNAAACACSTPLLTAIGDNNQRIVQLLLDMKADPNSGQSGGQLSLRVAINKHYSNIVYMLLDKGARLAPPGSEENATVSTKEAKVLKAVVRMHPGMLEKAPWLNHPLITSEMEQVSSDDGSWIMGSRHSSASTSSRSTGMMNPLTHRILFSKFGHGLGSESSIASFDQGSHGGWSSAQSSLSMHSDTSESPSSTSGEDNDRSGGSRLFNIFKTSRALRRSSRSSQGSGGGVVQRSSMLLSSNSSPRHSGKSLELGDDPHDDPLAAVLEDMNLAGFDGLSDDEDGGQSNESPAVDVAKLRAEFWPTQEDGTLRVQ